VHTSAGDLPVDPVVLKEYCTSVLAAAAGGSVLISAVEEMPPAVQDKLIELLAGPEFAPGTSIRVRLISGTTVSLLDRIADGTFSEQLFYRLNIIHLAVGRARSSILRRGRSCYTTSCGAPSSTVKPSRRCISTALLKARDFTPTVGCLRDVMRQAAVHSSGD
jgi:hypothetical protein